MFLRLLGAAVYAFLLILLKEEVSPFENLEVTQNPQERKGPKPGVLFGCYQPPKNVGESNLAILQPYGNFNRAHIKARASSGKLHIMMAKFARLLQKCKLLTITSRK